MLGRILDDVRENLRQEERRLLGELRVLVVRLEAPAENQKALARSIAQLDELFLLVAVGEFNAGKSTVLNAFLGERVLEEGVTPTTSRIGLVRHGPGRGRAPSGGDFEVITVPLEVLREINVVDTPGTNAVLRGHEALTREFVPRADLVVFVTSADRPFTESERAFLESIRAWGKKVVVALNKVDILETPEDVNAVVEFIKEKVLALVGFRPSVFAVSARVALRAKTEGNPALLQKSGFPALEQFVTDTLHEVVRLRLKLLNPLEVGLRVLGDAERAMEERLVLLEVDAAEVEETTGQLLKHRQELGKDVRLRLGAVDKALSELEQRGLAFLGENMRLYRAQSLLSREEMQADFERQVLADLPRVVERRVDEITELVGTREAQHAQGILGRVERRAALHAGKVPTPASKEFAFDRARLQKEIRRETSRALDSHDPRRDLLLLARGGRSAVLSTALLLVGALIVGTAGALLATGTALRVAVPLVAAALAALGLGLLPARRERVRTALRAKVAALREKIAAALASSFDRELEQSRQRLVEAMSPYSQFVRSEAERLAGLRRELDTHRQGLEALRARIESLR
jgi:small GTP-binding protein